MNYWHRFNYLENKVDTKINCHTVHIKKENTFDKLYKMREHYV